MTPARRLCTFVRANIEFGGEGVAETARRGAFVWGVQPVANSLVSLGNLVLKTPPCKHLKENLPFSEKNTCSRRLRAPFTKGFGQIAEKSTE